jgi:hypothetical protein
LQLVCDIPEPIKIVRVYHYNAVLVAARSSCFNWNSPQESFLHVASEEAVGLYKDWWEYTRFDLTTYCYPWKDAFNNILHRTQPVVEGVDISGGNAEPETATGGHLNPFKCHEVYRSEKRNR